MIILADANVWEPLRKYYEQGNPKSGTVIVEGHLVDSHFTHPVCDLSGKRVLGRVEFNKPIHDHIDKVELPYVKAAGFPDRTHLKRSLQMSLQRPVSKISVAQMRINEVAPDWCPACFLSATYLKNLKRMASSGRLKNILKLLKKTLKEELIFCNICHSEIDVSENDDLQAVSSRLKESYPEGNVVMLPIMVFKKNHKKVLAVAGENWKLL
jgi:hypothetical protein